MITKERFTGKIFLIVLIAMAMTIITCCDRYKLPGDEERRELNNKLRELVGCGYTYSETLFRIEKFLKIKEEYDGQKLLLGSDEPLELKLERPDTFDTSDEARYSIVLMDFEDGIYEGIRVLQDDPVPAETENTTIETTIKTTEETTEATTEESVSTETTTTETTPAETTTEETTSESTTVTTQEPLPEASVEEYKTYLEGWWKRPDSSGGYHFMDVFREYEAQGLTVVYSIDSETGGLHVIITGEAEGVTVNLDWVYVRIDDDHLSFIQRSEGLEAVTYERYAGPDNG